MTWAMMMPAASGRNFKRNTDTDTLDDKKKSGLLRRKVFPRGRTRPTSSSARSLERAPTFSSKGSSDAFSDVALITSVEEPLLSSDDKLPIVINFHEHNYIDEGDGQVQAINVLNGGDVGEEQNTWDDFFSNLLESIQCFPLSQPFGHSDLSNVATFDGVIANDFHGNTTTIECILDHKDEEEPNENKTPTPLDDYRHLSSRDVVPPLSVWIQDPLLLVATPGRSGMLIRRIRRASEPSYFRSLASPNSAISIGRTNLENNQIIQLPINNGTEQPSQSWVIDFESDLFTGTALFRIRGCSPWISQPPVFNSTDYFAKQNRKFQMVIRGKFKSNDVIMADCMAGLFLDYPVATSRSPNTTCVDPTSCSDGLETRGKESNQSDKLKRPRMLKRGKSSTAENLPSKWALRTAVKVAGVFSPRIDANLECAHPRILNPLCYTAQTISVSRKNSAEGISTCIDETHIEPSPHSDASLVYDLNNILATKKLASATTSHVQQRKRAFNDACDASVETSSKSACFDPDAEYTFEFLQHLVDYKDLSLDLGRVVGKLRLGGALRGQPIRYIGAQVKQSDINSLSMDELDCLWSFDIWHKCLLPDLM